jgi:endoglucanase
VNRPFLASNSKKLRHPERSEGPLYLDRLTTSCRPTLILTLLICTLLTGCQAQQPWPLWQAYSARFIDPQGRVIDRTASDRTTSESEAYALFFALVDNDRPTFDKLLNWTQDNLAQGDLTTHLPAWNWGKNSVGSWRVLDENSASDADLWLAYTLLQAGRLWSNPTFTALGRAIATNIAHTEVVLIPGLGTTLASGPHGFRPALDRYILNPSYMPLPVLAGLAHDDPTGPWSSIANSFPQLLRRAQTSGFALDWVSAGSDGVGPWSPSNPQQAVASYDAIRVYLWAGIADPATPGVQESLNAIPGMARYLKSTSIPPITVTSSATITQQNSPIGFSAAVIPYLLATGNDALARTQTDRLSAQRDPATGLYGTPPAYYDQNLALFSTGWMEQRYHFDAAGTLHVKWK